MDHDTPASPDTEQLTAALEVLSASLTELSERVVDARGPMTFLLGFPMRLDRAQMVDEIVGWLRSDDPLEEISVAATAQVLASDAIKRWAADGHQPPLVHGWTPVEVYSSQVLRSRDLASFTEDAKLAYEELHKQHAAGSLHQVLELLARIVRGSSPA